MSTPGSSEGVSWIDVAASAAGIRARGFVKPLNAAARLDNEENATLLKAIASVGPTERGDPPPSQDYPAESYQRLAGRTDGIRVRSRTCGRSDRPGRRGRRGRLLRRRERIGQTLIPMTNPVPERDPGSRPRLDPQAMNERDAAIAKLLARGWSYRAIAAQLHCSLGTVTKAVTRLREGPRPPRPWTRPKPVHRGGPFGDRTDDNW